MNRWICFFICILLGLTALVCGVLLPVYLRAVDADVVRAAGKNTPGLIEHGLKLAGENKLGGAQLLLKAAAVTKMPGQEKLLAATETLAKKRPDLVFWGSDEPVFNVLFSVDSSGTISNQPFSEFIIRTDNREKALSILGVSSKLPVLQLMLTRTLTNTVIFSPSQSASGQAFDAALAICGLLVERGILEEDLSNEIVATATDADRGGNPEPFENALLDFMSLGQRFNWGQLVSFTEKIPDLKTLHTLTDYVRRDSDLPVLYSLVEMTGRPSAVAGYLSKFSETGFGDLQAALRSGTGGANLLLDRDQRLFQPKLAYVLGLDFSLRNPVFALTVKWILYLCGGILLAMALHVGWQPESGLNWPPRVRVFDIARGAIIALGFVLVVVLLSEPFLAQESQKVATPFRLHLPSLGGITPAENTVKNGTFMNATSLLTMLLFFVLQAILYSASLVKLAEIRRQDTPAHVKLKLLENEDHLFDAGLYLGFLGTIISLILVSMGVFKQPSLMAAYSSTSFGILFVVLFKVVNLRAARRKLLLEAEAAKAQELADMPNPFASPLL